MPQENQAPKILVIGPSWVGDMVMAQSLFIELKRQQPEAKIDVLAPAWSKPILDRMPEVNRAIEMPVSHGTFDWKTRKQIGHRLREEKYDQAIILPNSWKSALIPWFANIPIRTGWKGEMRYGLLNDIRKLDKQALPMMVQRFVSLAYPKSASHQAPPYDQPVMRSEIPDNRHNPVREQGQRRLILCPGAEFGPAKQWPIAHYAQLADHYLTLGWQVLVLGSKADEETGKQLSTLSQSEHKSHLIDLTGKTQLDEAIDILGTADLVVSNDSGLMHIASALQRQLVVIYGATSPKFTPPLSDKARIIKLEMACSPCFERSCPLKHHDCMKQLPPQQVIETIDAMVHKNNV